MTTIKYGSQTSTHLGLVQELLDLMRNEKAFKINGADLPNFDPPEIVQNSKRVGDGENKQPDIDAFDGAAQVYARGEAKTGDGDIATEHSKTQFRLFANLEYKGRPSLLFIIVPRSAVVQLETVLRELGLLGRRHVVIVPSRKYA